MTGEAGEGGLAPVIPLFPDRARAADSAPAADRARAGDPPPVADPARAADSAPAEDRAAERWDASWIDDPPQRADAEEEDGDVTRAESVLLRKLRARPLSVSEAERVLRGEGASEAAAVALIARFVDLGYLDDVALAERLVELASERRGQGRHAIAQTLVTRGIPRHVADVALAGLPDDEEERALEFARSKARSMRGLDAQTALRRLSGQLARRGYASSVALSAARQALTE